MPSALVALLFAFSLAVQSATINVDVDGFRPSAVVSLVSGALGDYAECNDDDSKLDGASVTLAIAYLD